MADLLIPEHQAGARWRDRVREDVHPLLGSSLVTAALVAVAAVSIFVPMLGVLAIAVVTTLLLHAAIKAAVTK